MKSEIKDGPGRRALPKNTANPETDELSAAEIKKYLGAASSFFDINIEKTVTSTNSLVKENAASLHSGFTLIAGEQLRGRGRLGKSFYSPKGSGIYMSLLLKPEKEYARNPLEITTMAAVAACHAISAVTGKSPRVKWVNDIFLDKRKVCGILTEGSFDAKGRLNYAVLGIGINVYAPEEGFPKDLLGVAGSILKKPAMPIKNRLAAAFLESFFEYYSEKKTGFQDEYRRLCFLPGKDIWVIQGKRKRKARALYLTEGLELVVKYDEGSTEALSSGEVSIIQA